MDLRYFYLTGHYRKPLNFTWGGLKAAREARQKLIRMVSEWGEARIGCAEFESRFKEAIEDDLNMPQALAIVWELVKSDYPGEAKKKSLLKRLLSMTRMLYCLRLQHPHLIMIFNYLMN